MNQIVDNAIVLKRIDYGEADRILTLLTEKHGKISVIAKGVRKPKSRLAGGIELFTVGAITYLDGKNELKTLVSAHTKDNYTSIVTSMPATKAAYDIIKFTQSYTETICEDDYFTVTRLGLEALCNGLSPTIVDVWYGVNMLAMSGHGINLSVDTLGEKLVLDQKYSFDIADMALKKDENGAIDSRHVKLLRLCGMIQPQKLAMVQDVQQICEDIAVYVQDALQYNSHQSL